MSTDPTVEERNEDRDQERTADGSDDTGSTPASGVPISVKVSTPQTVIEENTRRAEMSGGYFTKHPSAWEQRAQFATSNDNTSEPSVDSSDVTATGEIEPPSDSASTLRPSERPVPHSTDSGMSIQSVDSTATITAASSDPLLTTTGQLRPAFPNQSYAALHHQRYPPPYPPPFLKQRSAHPGQIATFTSALASVHQSGSRTAGNSPAVTPGPTGLFSPETPVPLPPTWETPSTLTAPPTYASPFLHFTQRVPPKETHVADVDVDPVSGRKLINHYEIIDELGRGTHGKVKLGRDLDTDSQYVAIKIVERFSRRRKLGKLGTTEDKVKKEVAILKQARHPNVVALLEVIDDPSRKKVYLVLEWVERGEIKWRTKGAREICVVEARRYERERSGKATEYQTAEDLAVYNEALKRLSWDKRRQQRAFRRGRRDASDDPEMWSLEVVGDDFSDLSDDDKLSRISTESHSSKLLHDNGRRGSRTPSPLPPTAEADSTTSEGTAHGQLYTTEPPTLSPTTSRRDFGEYNYTGLEGTMYGAYMPTYSSDTSRVPSLNNSISGSRGKGKGSSDSLTQLAQDILDNGLDDDLMYVPQMTMQQIRVAFRDTLLGLQYLHHQGIVHRDIKPPNLLATKDHRVKISDFGVSYLGRPIQEDDPGEGVGEHETQDLADEAKELAKTVGTPAFYAPELCITEPGDDPLPITKAIDVWALGVTLFCMLYARTPFVDDQFVVMRQIAEEEIYIPRQRLKPVDDKPRSRPSSHGRAPPPIPNNRRPAFDFAYEDIGEDLYDLLKRLLTKDPRKRITLEEVRHHPWVVADLLDKVAWLEETDPTRSKQGKKIVISKEDVNAAVVPLFMDRFRSIGSTVKKVLGFGGSGSGGKSTGRGRTRSTVGTKEAGVSPTPSNASSSTSISRDGRRHSLRGDESLISALKASREGEHPLSRSLAASPELDKHDPYFDQAASQPDSAVGDVEHAEPDTPSRTLAPEQLVKETGGSMRTVTQEDFASKEDGSLPPSPGLPETPTAVDLPGAVNTGGVSGMARRILNTVRERSTARSTEARAPSSDRGSVRSVDTHGEPSLAVSQTTAEGHVNSPTVIDDIPPGLGPSSTQPSPSASRPVSLASSPSADRLSASAAEAGNLSRTSSTGSASSLGRRAVLQNTSLSHSPVKRHSHIPNESTAEEWQRATDEHVRKLIRENEADAEPTSPFDDRTCPPSPDDQSRRMSEAGIANVASPPEMSPTGQHSQLPPAMVSSSSDFGSTSAVSISMSNPSIPSVVSGASSVDVMDTETTYAPPHEKADLMSSDDTINPRMRYSKEEAPDEGYTADNPDNAFNSEEDEYGSSSDSDGGLVMSRRKSATKTGEKAASRGPKERRGTGLSVRSKKSSRSGSSNTMKKVRTRDSEDEQRRQAPAPAAEESSES